MWIQVSLVIRGRYGLFKKLGSKGSSLVWSNGERWGLTVWAKVLGCEFNSRVRLKTRWLKLTTWWRKRTIIIKTAKRGKSRQKIFLKNWVLLGFYRSQVSSIEKAVLQELCGQKMYLWNKQGKIKSIILWKFWKYITKKCRCKPHNIKM